MSLSWKWLTAGFALAFLAALAAWWLRPNAFPDLLRRWSVRPPVSTVQSAKEQRLRALTKAAEAGDAVAQYEIYEATSDREQWKVRHWLESSAQAGYPRAQCQRGQVADAEEDYPTAVYWYRKAAAQGDSRAELQLAYEYQTGRGVSVDNWTAYEWMSKAAEQGEAFAAENIGMCHFSGNCPPLHRDYASACKWLLIAHALGNGPTCNDEIQARITSAQLQAAKDAASSFLRLNGLPRQR